MRVVRSHAKGDCHGLLGCYGLKNLINRTFVLLYAGFPVLRRFPMRLQPSFQPTPVCFRYGLFPTRIGRASGFRR